MLNIVYHVPFPTPPLHRLEISNRVGTRLHPGSNIPILNQTRSDHPPDPGDSALSERDAVALKVNGAKGGTGQVCADKNTFDVNRTAFELSRLEGYDNRGAVLLRGKRWGLASASCLKK